MSGGKNSGRTDGMPGAESLDTQHSDARLLAQFAATRDEDAFAELVRQHGGLVLGVCLRVLGNRQDAEDVAQAVFLALARSAGKLRADKPLAPWLHHVAWQAALNARRSATRRRRLEGEVRSMPAPTADSLDPTLHAELLRYLDQELNGLPDKYRMPVLLFHVEGHSTRETARMLRENEATVSTRLHRAREILKERLAARGQVLSLALLSSVLARANLAEEISASFVSKTAEYAAVAAAGNLGATALIPPQVCQLTQGILNMIFWTQVKIAMAAVVLLCLLGAGSVAVNTLVAQEAPHPAPVASDEPSVHEPERLAEPAFPRNLPAPRSDVPQDLLISPKQNLELMRKAWKTQITCAYRNKKPDEILQDLARQSGLKIRMLPSVQPLRGGGPSSPAEYGLGTPASWERANYFLGSDAAVLEMAGKRLTLQDAFTRLETAQPTSLAPVLETMARLLGRNVSYRDDEIVLGSPEDLLPELLVTCRIKLTKGGWGQMYHVNLNGTPRTIRLSLEDAVAYHMLLFSDMQIQHAGMNFGDPRGAAVAMRKFKPGLDIQFDPATKTLELSGTPQMVCIWQARVLREVDQAEPDGPAFQAARLKQWAQETAGNADAATRADLEKHAALLEADAYSVRLKAVDDLIAQGKDAAYAVLPLEARTESREARLRAQIVLHKIYGDEEIRQVRARAEGYLKAATSGNLAVLRDEYWDKARKERFEKRGQETQRLASLLKKPQDYESEYKKNLMIQDVKIEQIALSGSTACITFSTTSKKDLFQVDRVVSAFYMVFDGKTWMAGPGGADLPIEQPILWTAKDGLPTEELDPSATHIVTGKYSDGTKDSLSVRSYGIDFGF